MSSPSVADALTSSMTFTTVTQNETTLPENQAPAGTPTHGGSFKGPRSQCKSQDAINSGQLLEGEDVPGLFLDSLSCDFGINDPQVLESENIPHSVLNTLQNTTVLVAPHLDSILDVGHEGDGIPGMDVDHPASWRAITGDVETNSELVFLKERRDAALFDYKQSVKEVHRHAANVAWLDMCYTKALRGAHLGQD